ncbi:uncharacterized protein B0J16DRAFT_332905 [Fusarium flagelliforme]|uniref:Uncharacterized protein n=1 Tax=Fusarium flagelliforme TaxID=2675880 RepID=A0A395M7T3_9HYPO|nr:uncharacterized protein B0J16DRAFT_332905 [Fusarium flagelliforme]KAH7192365.1 hypothetical protein B0J16DRAFT_332905 [Fusarium flagelliforme]RFN43910.1 hypothetical protein FIE12Z_11858 [Fusarium flagelliforme]
MGKKREKKKSKAADEAQPQAPTSTPSNILTTTSAIAADPALGYKVRVLLYDFLNVTKDNNSEKRINCTTDEYHISGPYFDETQVAIIKAATVDVDLDRYAEDNGTEDLDSVMVSQQGQSFEDAVRALLCSFIDKRRASGGARPCGPHHLAPMYAKFFGIEMEELKDAKFLSRLRRSGI